MNLLKCDCCGKIEEFDKHNFKLLKVYYYNRYGSDIWDYSLHICKDCLKKIFRKV